MANEKPFTPGKGAKKAKGKSTDAKGTPPGSSTPTGPSSAKASATKGKTSRPAAKAGSKKK